MLLTVTVKLQEAELPLPSTAVQVTVVLPIGNDVPDAGVHEELTLPELSCALGALYVTTTREPEEMSTVFDPGQEIVGGIVSLQVTLTEKQQEALLPLVSSVVQVTVVLPMGNPLPEAGTQDVLATLTLSWDVGKLYETTAFVPEVDV